MGVEQRSNAVLGALLAELGWSPSRLADAVNGMLGPGYVARSTVSEWFTWTGCRATRCPPSWPT